MSIWSDAIIAFCVKYILLRDKGLKSRKDDLKPKGKAELIPNSKGS
jgi:hypothetical protein